MVGKWTVIALLVLTVCRTDAACSDITGMYKDGGSAGGMVEVVQAGCRFAAAWHDNDLYAIGTISGTGIDMQITGRRCACGDNQATYVGKDIQFNGGGARWTYVGPLSNTTLDLRASCSNIEGEYTDTGSAGGDLEIVQTGCRFAAVWQNTELFAIGTVSGTAVDMGITDLSCTCGSNPATVQSSGAIRFNDGGAEWDNKRPLPAPTPAPPPTPQPPTPPPAPVPAGAVRLIIDTDMGFDVDDVVAVCTAHALENLGEASIQAIVHDTGFNKGIGAVSVLNHYYGRDSIPLGAYKGPFGRDGSTQNRYVSDLVSNYDSPVKDYSQVPSAAETLRKVLAQQPDNSVRIASIGMTTNMRDLLQSQADQYSSLDGVALVAKKVHSVWWMDMMYNFGCAEHDNGPAWLGSDTGCRGSAQIAVGDWPATVKQVFQSNGGDIITGDALVGCANNSNPCRKAIMDWTNGDGRSSWDPLTVLAAVRGASAAHLFEADSGGYMTVAEGGEEQWHDGTGHLQSRARYSNNAQGAIKNDINDLICRQPASRPDAK